MIETLYTRNPICYDLYPSMYLLPSTLGVKFAVVFAASCMCPVGVSPICYEPSFAACPEKQPLTLNKLMK